MLIGICVGQKSDILSDCRIRNVTVHHYEKSVELRYRIPESWECRGRKIDLIKIEGFSWEYLGWDRVLNFRTNTSIQIIFDHMTFGPGPTKQKRGIQHKFQLTPITTRGEEGPTSKNTYVWTGHKVKLEHFYSFY
jgi:hypothetical protein